MNHEQRFLSSLHLFLLLQSCISMDILTPNQTIVDGDSLTSKGEIFELGFFSPGNSSHQYLGIWYKEDSEKTVVWVANRDSPIIATSMVLSIKNGNLLACGPNQTNCWGTNVSGSSTNIAQLLDSGNLVLFQNDTNNVLWQSFDHPTDTVLPGMKLGLDRKTGLDRFLTSWKSAYDPGIGNYSYKFDPSGSPQLFMWKGQVQLWRTGPWNGFRWSGVPEMTQNYFIVNASITESYEESAVMYETVNSSTLSRLMVDNSGSVRWLARQNGKWIEFWSAPKDQCDYYGHCGAYGNCDPNNANECTCLPGYELKSASNGSDGCVTKRVALSTCGDGEGFVKVERVKAPDTSAVRVDASMNTKACEEECLRQCSCRAYANADVRGGGSGCVTWYGDLMDTREYSHTGQDLYVRVDAVEFAQYVKKSESFLAKKGMLAILVVSIVVMLFLIVSSAYWLIMRKRKGTGREGRPKFLTNVTTSSTSFEDSSGQTEVDESTDPTLHLYELSTIVAATDNFSSDNKLGEGGFGSVYKGCLVNGQEIAVKRLSKNSGQGIEEFKNEVTLIAKLQHRNLVKLLGCCIHKEERILIYEYSANKSLDFFIFDESRKMLLDWRKRYEIIGGIARGILYLHQDSRLRIIHRDLKASNVLLDAVMNPKISDFGMARIFGGNQIDAKTNRVVGTYGYMSPEYAMAGLYSIKSDVFSFGVLLLEIISGRKNNNYCDESPNLNLIGHVWELWREGKALEIVDSSLGDSYPAHEVLRCIHIGLLCVQECAADRPTMSAVVFMLGHETNLSTPKQPAFILKTDCIVPTISVNEVTLTMVDAR